MQSLKLCYFCSYHVLNRSKREERTSCHLYIGSVTLYQTKESEIVNIYSYVFIMTNGGTKKGKQEQVSKDLV